VSRRVAIASTLVLLGAGCAYYNGLYNANRLANDARRAEREGRTGEARSLWSQAAIKAESVVARFPNSKYRDDALLLQGMALFSINACSQAVSPLTVAADSSPDAVISAQSRLLLARCRLTMFEPDSARLTLDPLVAEADSPDRREALLLRGQAALALGDDSAARRDLEESAHPLAVFPLAVVLVRQHEHDRAADVLAAATARPYDESRWLETLDTLGLERIERASQLVSTLLERPDLGPGARARLLVGDGDRWRNAGEPERAAGRFRLAVELVPDSIEGRLAQAHLMVAAIRQSPDLDYLPGLLDTLRTATERGGAPAMVAGRFVTILRRVVAAMSQDTADLALFVAAEDVRDTLGIRPLAAALFERVAQAYPQSVIAPKALLAAAVLQPDRRQVLLEQVRREYSRSVYVRALSGDAGPEYHAVEDSLRQLLPAVTERRRRRSRNEP